MSCEYCNRQSYIYNMACEVCRIRHIQRESCKLLRKIYKQMHDKKGYEVQGLQGGNHCDCEKMCVRKSRIKKKEEVGNRSVQKRQTVKKNTTITLFDV